MMNTVLYEEVPDVDVHSDEAVFACFEALCALRDGTAEPTTLSTRVAELSESFRTMDAHWQLFATGLAEAVGGRIARSGDAFAEDELAAIDLALNHLLAAGAGAEINDVSLEVLSGLSILGWPEARVWCERIRGLDGLPPEEDALIGAKPVGSSDWDVLLTGIESLLNRSTPGAALVDDVSAVPIPSVIWMDQKGLAMLAESIEHIVSEVLPALLDPSEPVDLVLDDYRRRVQLCREACMLLEAPELSLLFEVVDENLAPLQDPVPEPALIPLLQWAEMAHAYLQSPHAALGARLADTSLDRAWYQGDEDRAEALRDLLERVRSGAGVIQAQSLPKHLPVEEWAGALREDPLLLGSFLREMPSLVDQFREAVAAFEHDAGSLLALRRIAHSLKGVAQTVDLTGLALLMHAAEEVLEVDSMSPQERANLAPVFRDVADVAAMTLDAITESSDLPIERAERAYQSLKDFLSQASMNPVQAKANPEPTEVNAPIDEDEAERAPIAAAEDEASDTQNTESNALEERFAVLAEGAAKLLLQDSSRAQQVLDKVGSLKMALQRVQHLQPLRADVHWFTLRRAAEHVCLTLSEAEAHQAEGRRMAEALRDIALQARYEDLSTVGPWLQHTVAQAARVTQKAVDFEIDIDPQVLERRMVTALREVLSHIVRNAVDHGLETPVARESLNKAPTGKIRVTVVRDENKLLIRCEDDGLGLDEAAIVSRARAMGLLDQNEAPPSGEALWRYILAPGFSTRPNPTVLSGRGVGLDQVRSVLDQLHGTLHIASTPGHGTSFTLIIPIPRWVAPVLLLSLGDVLLAVPQDLVSSVCGVDDIQAVEGGPGVMVDGQVVSIAPLGPSVGLAFDPERDRVVLLENAAPGLARGWRVPTPQRQSLVCQPWPHTVAHRPGYQGTAILPDGRVALLLDPGRLEVTPDLSSNAKSTNVVMIAHPDLELVAQIRARANRHGWQVHVAGDGLSGLAMARRCQPEWVILGRGLMGLDAEELARVLRVLEDTQRARLILFNPAEPAGSRGPFDLQINSIEDLAFSDA